MIDKQKKTLSIQVSLNGLSFSIYNGANNSIEYIDTISFEKRLNPFETLEKLKSELASNTKFSDDFENVKVIHHNELATLVPEELYDESNNAEYLKYNSKILKTDFIASDELKSQDAVSVYVPYVNINNYIFDTFGAFDYTHESTVYIDTTQTLITEDETSVFINVEANTMQMAIYKNRTLQLYNFFEFDTPEDFINYILFTCEQEHLNPEILKLFLVGDIKENDANYDIAYKYIRNVEVVGDSKQFIIKNSI